MGARNDDGGPAVGASVAMVSLTDYKHHGRFELHMDQRAAAAEVIGRELAMVTENVGKWLYESSGQGSGKPGSTLLRCRAAAQKPRV